MIVIASTTVLPPVVDLDGRSIRIGGSRYPLLLPKLGDSRLHLAGVIFSLQALGQTVLGFDLSIAQILVSLGTVAVLEVAITFSQQRVVAWPASALLTGNGVAFILRVPGTEHGDWWSLNGAHIYAAVAALSLLSKYVIRAADRHIFNPSNFGLSVGFLILGSANADPQDLWWGPISPGLLVTLIIIVTGGIVITWRNRLIGTAAAFFVTFALGTGVLAAGGHCVQARWHVGPLCNTSYWWTLVSSPEILVFLFFMITDPKTIPSSRRGRVAHGASVGVLATLLAAPQTTEFATKVAILVALVVVCAFRPVFDRRFSAGVLLEPARRVGRARTGVMALGGIALFGAAVLAAGLPSRTLPPDAQTAAAVIALAGDRPVVELAKGAVPKVRIDDSARRIQPPVTDAEAQRMGRDVVEDLIIEADALRARDADLAATAVAGPRLDALRATLGSAGPGGAIEATSYGIASLTLVQVRDPARPQSPPSLALRITGTKRVSSSPAAGVDDGRLGPATPIEFSLVLADGGTHFVIMGDAPGS